MDIEIQHRHSVRHTHCCMAEMVAALSITRDPVDGGTWGKHGGRRKLAVTAVCAHFGRRDVKDSQAAGELGYWSFLYPIPMPRYASNAILHLSSHSKDFPSFQN